MLLLGKKSCSLLDHGRLFDHRFLLELMISFSSSSSRASIARRAEALLGWRNARRMAWRSWAKDCRWRRLGVGDLALETAVRFLCFRSRSFFALAYATAAWHFLTRTGCRPSRSLRYRYWLPAPQRRWGLFEASLIRLAPWRPLNSLQGFGASIIHLPDWILLLCHFVELYGRAWMQPGSKLQLGYSPWNTDWFTNGLTREMSRSYFLRYDVEVLLWILVVF